MQTPFRVAFEGPAPPPRVEAVMEDDVARGAARPPGQTRHESPDGGALRSKGRTLRPYANEARRHTPLSPEDELSLAQSIEELEIAHWFAILSHPHAPEVVLRAVHGQLGSTGTVVDPLRALARAPTSAANMTPRRSLSIHDVAVALRAADKDRRALRAADAAVDRAFAGVQEGAPYLRRVAEARAAEQRAKRRFVLCNLRLVLLIARRFDRDLLPWADLVQEGSLGLMRAVERYDYHRGIRFSTYATWWIRNALSRAVADKARLVRVPAHMLDDAHRMARAKGASATQRGRPPNPQELCSQTGLSERKQNFLRECAERPAPISLDTGLGSDGEATLNDILTSPAGRTPEDTYSAIEGAAHLGQLLGKLSPLEASVLYYRYGLAGDDPLTLSAIGTKFYLSRERIRQLQQQALGKLRSELQPRTDATALPPTACCDQGPIRTDGRAQARMSGPGEKRVRSAASDYLAREWFPLTWDTRRAGGPHITPKPARGEVGGQCQRGGLLEYVSCARDELESPRTPQRDVGTATGVDEAIVQAGRDQHRRDRVVGARQQVKVVFTVAHDERAHATSQRIDRSDGRGREDTADQQAEGPRPYDLDAVEPTGSEPQVRGQHRKVSGPGDRHRARRAAPRCSRGQAQRRQRGTPEDLAQEAIVIDAQWDVRTVRHDNRANSLWRHVEVGTHERAPYRDLNLTQPCGVQRSVSMRHDAPARLSRPSRSTTGPRSPRVCTRGT